MSDSKIFPQEWHEHLREDANIFAQHKTSPVGSHCLLFESMHSKQFEQFCWWLLRKDHSIEGCQRLGNMGNKSQEGIDSFAYNYLNPDQLIVYECKCYKSFRPYDLKNAIDEFLKGKWAKLAKSFVLIVAQEGIQNLEEEWRLAKKRLENANSPIKADLWTSEELTRRLQTAPDILFKFFPQETFNQFCNTAMLIEGFREDLHKATRDPRPIVQKVVSQISNNNFLGYEQLEKIFCGGRNWRIELPWVEISAFLPSEGPMQYTGHASIWIKQPDTNGVQVIVNQKWLLNNFLGNDGEPLEPSIRPFYQGFYEKQCFIDFPGCRFYVPEKTANELVRAADKLSKVYLDALENLEIKWEAKNFLFVNWSGTKVALCTVNKWLWQSILEFSQTHDIDNGNSSWHIFNANPIKLMPYAIKGRYFCAVLDARHIDGLCYNDEVAILWEPPNSFSAPQPDHYWSCQKVYNWFKDNLIPAVGEWRAQQKSSSIKSFFVVTDKKRKLVESNYLAYWHEVASITDKRKISLLENNQFMKIGVEKTVAILQGFYNGGGNCSRAYFTSEEIKGLYKIIFILLAGNRGHVDFIKGNLGFYSVFENYDVSSKTHNDLKRDIEKFLQINQIISNTIVIDHKIRAMLELIDNNDDWIPNVDKEQIFQFLHPFMKFYDKQLVIDRHSLYI